MTPEQQRIAIAEICGIQIVQAEDGWWDKWVNGTNYKSGAYKENIIEELPDYLNCKNAMQEARQTKWHDVKFRAKYAEELHKICDYVPCGSLNASPEQEAKAFLIACGK